MQTAYPADESFRGRITDAVEHELLRVHPKWRQDALIRLAKHWSIHCFDTVPSTMDLAREAVHRKEETAAGVLQATEMDESISNKISMLVRPQVFVAREQTAGRGRNNRSWVSGRDVGVYATFVSFPEVAPEKLAGLSLVVGLAIQRTVSAYGASTCLKWPNDVIVDLEGGLGFRKLAGVLVETTSKGGQVEMVSVGIGLNLATQTVPGDIAAIGLNEVAAAKIDYFRVFASLFLAIIEISERFFTEGLSPFVSEWTERSRMTGRRVRFVESGQPMTGTVLGIDSQGGLRIRHLAGTEAETVVYSGEVQMV